MKNILLGIAIFSFAISSLLVLAPATASAKSSKSGGYYYKSAKTGKFISPKTYRSRPSSTYRSRR